MELNRWSGEGQKSNLPSLSSEMASILVLGKIRESRLAVQILVLNSWPGISMQIFFCNFGSKMSTRREQAVDLLSQRFATACATSGRRIKYLICDLRSRCRNFFFLLFFMMTKLTGRAGKGWADVRWMKKNSRT